MLIPDEETLVKYMQFHEDMDFEVIQPELKRADQLFILDPLFGIGQEFYDEITQVATPAGKQEEVLDLLRSATADFAFTIFARMHSVNISNSGISVTRNEHAAPASDAKIEGIVTERKKTAFRFLELALQLLEKNADIFSTWKSSTAYTIRRELFISSVDEFDRFVFIERSRIMYMQLRSLILQGEVELIKPELGEDLYTLLKAEYQANNLKAVHLPVVEYIQRILANYACGMHKKDEYMLKTAKKHQKGMIDFLRKNRKDYPLLPESSTQGRAPFPNKPDSSQFVF